MRITTGMLLKNYQSNLGNAVANMSSAQMKVLTQRNFNKIAEDPASALRASILERKYAQNDDYLSIIDEVQSHQDAQEDAISQMVTLAKQIAKDDSLRALNGTTSETQRAIFAESLRSVQKSMVSSMNAQYVDNYVFTGTDGKNMPFHLSEDGKTLTYRGIDVSTGLDASGNAAHPSLDALSKEHLYVDLGLGMNTNAAGNITPSSAFDTALPGINVTGYGKSNGMDNNMILLAGQMAELLEQPDFDTGKFTELLGQFDKGFDNLLNTQTNLGVKTQFLTSTKERLEDNSLALATQIDSIVNADMAAAITNYSYSQYAYNAALRVGTNILSPSFIDFMS